MKSSTTRDTTSPQRPSGHDSRLFLNECFISSRRVVFKKTLADVDSRSTQVKSTLLTVSRTSLTSHESTRWISSWTISPLNPLADVKKRQDWASVIPQIFNSGAATPGEIPGDKT